VNSYAYVLNHVYGSPYGDEIKMQEGTWTPLTHKLYTPEFKEVVKTVLLCMLRNGLPTLPKDVLAMLFNMIAPTLECVTHIDTLFPSSKIRNQTKGGLLLLELKKDPLVHTKTSNMKLNLELRYVANGGHAKNCSVVEIDLSKRNYYSSEGIEKGVLLQRYVSTLKEFVESRKQSVGNMNRFTTYFATQAPRFGGCLDDNLKTLQRFSQDHVPPQQENGCITM